MPRCVLIMAYESFYFLFWDLFFLLMFCWKVFDAESLTHFTTHFMQRLIYSSFPCFPPQCSLTFSKRTDGRKAAWHSFLMVQLSGRGASSWFMVPTLHGGATGAQFFFLAPGSMLPHWGGKNGRRSPTPTAKEHASPRAWPSKENHWLICHHLETFTFPWNEALA